MASNLKMLQSNNLTAIDLIDAIRPKRSSLKRLNSKKSLTSSSGPSSPTKFDEKFNPSIVLPSAKQIIDNLNKQSLLNDETKLNLDAQQPQPFRSRMKSNSCFDILQKSQESSYFRSRIGSSFGSKLELKSELKSESKSDSRSPSEPKSTTQLKSSSDQEITSNLNPFKRSSLSKNPSKTTISSSKSSNSDHNTSSGVCNVENSSKNEEYDDFDDSLSIASSGFAKNGGASQFGSGINLDQNISISNKFSNILFASALLKAEKKRRIGQWISELSLECS